MLAYLPTVRQVLARHLQWKAQKNLVGSITELLRSYSALLRRERTQFGMKYQWASWKYTMSRFGICLFQDLNKAWKGSYKIIFSLFLQASGVILQRVAKLSRTKRTMYLVKYDFYQLTILVWLRMIPVVDYRKFESNPKLPYDSFMLVPWIYFRLEIKQDGEGMHHVPGLVEAHVNNMNEVWEALRTGSNARAVGSTNANEHSSRSHWFVHIIYSRFSFVYTLCHYY